MKSTDKAKTEGGMVQERTLRQWALRKNIFICRLLNRPHLYRLKLEKVYFPAKSLAVVVIEMPKGVTHFYLSIGLTKRGDKTF